MNNKAKLKQQVVQAVEDQQDELLQLCSELIQINSENPEGDTTEITNYIKDYLKEYDFLIDEYQPADKKFNLISSYGDASKGKTLIYCGHTDVVPAGNLDKWDFDPNSGEIKDGYLLGRGASDMKAGLGGLIFTTVLMKRMNIELPGQVTLVIVPDEETGSEFGIQWLLANDLIKGDGCLIAEPSSEYNPTIGQKGSFVFELEVFGEPGHGSLSPLIGKHAINDMMKALERVQSVYDIEIELPPETHELIEVSQKYMREVEVEKEPFQKILERVSCNIGEIKGGTKSNVVPESCKAVIDCRLPFGINGDELEEYLRKELDSLDIDYTMTLAQPDIEIAANFTPASDPVCKAIVDNIEEISGHPAYGVMQWASSDARHFRAADIPVLQYGPAELSTIHGYNERVKVDEIILAAKVYAAAIIDFLFE